MGKIVPSFRIAIDVELKKWKIYRKYLDNKNNDKRKLFKQIFSISIARLYNSACSYSNNPFRIYPILISIILHNYNFFKNNKIIMRKMRMRMRTRTIAEAAAI